MPDTEAKAKWMKENFWALSLKLHRKHDADLVAYLETVDEKQKLIKQAVREYIEKHG